MLAPASVATWFEPLGGDPAAMILIGEGGRLADETVESISEAARNCVLRIHSGHDSLIRDLQLAEKLRCSGALVYSQSTEAVEAGLDKVVARRVMQDAAVPLTPWGLGETPGTEDILVKARESTQSRSIGWGQATRTLEPETYWEQWIDGPEYSVTGYRENSVLTLLPIVAKGPTRRDLLPPWRRPRWVKPGEPIRGAEAMYAYSSTIAEVLDIWGFFEVEFVVGEDVRVIEVNPRISGTLRLAAMAADVRIFAQGVLSNNAGILEPVLAGLEVPYEGDPVVEPGLIATSRLTCVAGTMDDVVREIGVRTRCSAQVLKELAASVSND